MSKYRAFIIKYTPHPGVVAFLICGCSYLLRGAIYQEVPPYWVGVAFVIAAVVGYQFQVVATLDASKMSAGDRERAHLHERNRLHFARKTSPREGDMPAEPASSAIVSEVQAVRLSRNQLRILDEADRKLRAHFRAEECLEEMDKP